MASLRTQTGIGLFVLGAFVLAVTAVFYLGSGRLFSDSTRFVLFFQDSVSGLNVGAPVLFRGVKVGQVTDIQLMADAENLQVHIPVIVNIRPFGLRGQESSQNFEQTMAGLIDRGLRGQLAMQSLVTGQFQICLDFHPQTQASLNGYSSHYPEIPTIPSSLQELSNRVSDLPVQEMANQLQRSLQSLDHLLSNKDLEQSLVLLRQTLNNTAQLSLELKQELPRTLASIRSTSDAAQVAVQKASKDISEVATDLSKTAEQGREVLHTADQRLGPLLAGLEQTFTSAGSTLEQTRTSLSQLSTLLSRDSGLNQELVKTLKDFQDTARSVQSLSDYLERHPEALLRGKQGY
ncbi:MAG: MlaD family protein [Desulfovermiculus sp.]